MLIALHTKDTNGWRHIITAPHNDAHAWRTDQDQFAINHLQNTGCMVVTMGQTMWEAKK
jgi:hypothetical protein